MHAPPKSMSSDFLLPVELLNEPFRYGYQDNEYRPEITVSRSPFLFKIDEWSVTVRVAGKECSVASYLEADEGEELPTKHKTNVSVLNVYDMYGLTITLEFLRHVSRNRHDHIEWIEIYLIGCMFALRLEPQCKQYIIQRIRSMVEDITVELMRREKCKAKLDCELVPQSLPIEIVALITGSVRISKEAALIVHARRASS